MAKTFLDPNETHKVVNNNTELFANTGIEKVILESGITGLTVDQNTEIVQFAGMTSDYAYLQKGNKVLVYSNNNVIATIPVQMDEDGTELIFTNTPVNIKLELTGELAGKMTFGGRVVSSSVPTPLEPAPVVQEHTINSFGTTVNNVETLDAFKISAGNYTHKIEGFNAGDVIDFLDGVTPTVTNNNFTDGNVTLQWASSGSVVKLDVTGLSSADDVKLSGIAGWDTVFGVGTII